LNEWVEKKTNNTIKKPIEFLNNEFVLVLVNVIYFKDDWLEKFEES